MRVLFATYPTAFHVPGGGEIQLLAYRRHLPAHGVEVTLFDPWQPNFAYFDCVHFFSCAGGSSHFCAFVKRLGLPLVVSSSLWPSEKTLTEYPVEEIRYQLSLADAIVTNSEAEAGQLVKLFGLPAEKFHTVKNAVEEWFLMPASAAPFRTYLGLAEPFVLNVGNIERRKNQVVLAEAMTAFPDHKLVLIGNVRDSSYLAAVRAAGGSQVIHCGPFAHDSELLRAAYAACVLFALPSLLETPGLAALEAAAQGAPLVLTSQGCCEEYFGTGARYADPYSQDAVRSAIAEVLRDPQAQFRRAPITVPTWSQVTEDLVSVYNNVLATAAKPKFDM